jgi:arylsulfatase A-like enzyme
MPTRSNTRTRTGAAACFAAVLLCAAALPLSAPGAPAPQKPNAVAPVDKPAGKGEKKESQAERKARLRKQARANRKQKRPNVIVITTDDQDDSMVGLPATTRLIGERGTTFTNSYVSFPLCCPARATFLSGQYAHNHGVTRTELPDGYGAFDNSNTLAVWLRRAGYRTAMVGKYLNGYGINDGIPERVADSKEIPPGWSEFFALTADTDQRRYRYKINDDGKIRKYRSGARNYVTDVLSGEAVDVVDEFAPRPKPFFLWFNPTAPHGEAGRPFGATRNPQPAPRHHGAFEGAIRPRTPNFNEADVSDKPPLS